MAVSLALLPSPLLGPSVWRPVARILTAHGWTTMTCTAPPTPRTGCDVLDAFLQELPVDEELVLIPHSNAGAYVPVLTTRRPVVGVVFVDAVLPPHRGHQPLAPPAFHEFLRQKADRGGVLPVWTDWWEEADVAAMFVDSETRTRIELEQPRLPLSYFQDQVDVPAGWDDRPAAYLALGDTYRREREDAERRHWPVTTIPAGHLNLVNNPAEVATALEDLFNLIGITRPRL